MTKREMFETIATVNADNAEIVEFCHREIELLNRKSTSKGMTKTQKENEGIMATILDDLAGFEEGATVTELIANGAGLEGFTNQKVSALLRKLVDAGKIQKEIKGKKAIFSLV